MPLIRSYQAAASAYAEGARAFFAPSPQRAGERRARTGPVPVSELASRAETLEIRSAELAAAASDQLAADDPALCLQASIALLAKALTDLEVSQALLLAAQEGAAERRGARGVKEPERSAPVTRPVDLDRTLQLLLGEEPEGAKRIERGGYLPGTVDEARQQLSGLAQTTPLLIRDRAAVAAWDALKGVAGIGAGQLAQAAGLAGMQVAEALGQAQQLTRLYELVRSFLGKALESIKVLLGPALAQTVGEQVVTWIKRVTTADRFARKLEGLYQAEATATALAKLAQESPADLPHFMTAIQGIDALEAADRKQIELVGKIVKAIRFLAFIPAGTVPAGKLLQAAAYILVGGYVVLAGGDYVDWPHLERIDRVPGVRRIMETHLA